MQNLKSFRTNHRFFHQLRRWESFGSFVSDEAAESIKIVQIGVTGGDVVFDDVFKVVFDEKLRTSCWRQRAEGQDPHPDVALVQDIDDAALVPAIIFFDHFKSLPVGLNFKLSGVIFNAHLSYILITYKLPLVQLTKLNKPGLSSISCINVSNLINYIDCK